MQRHRLVHGVGAGGLACERGKGCRIGGVAEGGAGARELPVAGPEARERGGPERAVLVGRAVGRLGPDLRAERDELGEIRNCLCAACTRIQPALA